MQKRNCAIDFLRIYMCILICFLHLCNQVLYPFNNTYGIPNINSIGLCVECFFIMSGFFLFLSKKTFKENTIARVVRLWPLLAFSTLLAGVLRLFHISGISLSFDDVLNLLFLQGTGILQNGATNGPAWYVGVLFWVSLVYCIVKSKFSIRKQIIIIGSSVVIGMLLLWIPQGDIIYNKVRGFVPHTKLSVMVVRAFIAIGLGYILGYVQKHIVEKNDLFSNLQTYQKYLFTIIEIFFFLAFTFLMFQGYTSFALIYNYYLTLFIFIFIFILFFNRVGYLSSKILNNKLGEIAGNYSYSIYIMQNACFFIITYLASRNIDFININKIFTISFSMFLFILMGILSKCIVDYTVKYITFIYKRITQKEE